MSVRSDRQGLLPDAEQSDTKQVECLGLTFESEAARREYFTERLRERLHDPEFRKIEGFPIGEDEDILALSDPPYYTACPNPFLEAFIDFYGRTDTSQDFYNRQPFATDVSEGKYDPVYKLHPYHTKVPHKAIMRYILHYTDPGDIVFDGFCGTGMTGAAAHLCGSQNEIESLGYKIKGDQIIDENSQPFAKVGSRYAAMGDLSPIATFIAYNYNRSVNTAQLVSEANSILREVDAECSWMFTTLHQPSARQLQKAIDLINAGNSKLLRESTLPIGTINYTVWSDVFICSECAGEVVFWNQAVDKAGGKVRDEFVCPSCNASLSKTSLERAWSTFYDTASKTTIQHAKQLPVLVNYSLGKKRFEKMVDNFDLALIDEINDSEIPYWIPQDQLPKGFNTEQPKVSHGITNVHHFYTKRNLWVLSSFMNKAEMRVHGFSLTRVASQVTKMYRLTYQNGVWGAGGGPLSGTLYVPSLIKELNIFKQLRQAVEQQWAIKANHGGSAFCVTTGSSTSLTFVKDSTIDYIFLDPPFGGNLMYSELNYIWESWLKVFTNNATEAIENTVQGKGLPEYQDLMIRCFQEFYRILKHGHWITIEFHNSKNAVWNSIQEALQRAGFVVADVRTLDKKHGTIKQITGGGAVKQDLIISAYKPETTLEQKFKLEAGKEVGVWEFVRSHLRQLPRFVRKDGQAEVIAERQNYLLFDRMVAFHVERGLTIPMSAAQFYASLQQQFPERDGMYFLPDQVSEYDKRRMTVSEVGQLELIPRDEDSAIKWLRQQLTNKPQKLQDLVPEFMKIATFSKHEKSIELSEIVEQNFLRYDGQGDVPNQIHSYLSTNFKDLRNLSKDAPALRVKAKDRWYVPDPNKAGDLEKVREKALLKEFAAYLESSQKKLKVFRLEAVRAGFQRAWQQRDYETIIQIGRKLPDTVLQEDPILLRFYDNALMRTGRAE